MASTFTSADDRSIPRWVQIGAILMIWISAITIFYSASSLIHTDDTRELDAQVSALESDTVEIEILADHEGEVIVLDTNGSLLLRVGPFDSGNQYTIDASGSDYSSDSSYNWNMHGERADLLICYTDRDLDGDIPTIDDCWRTYETTFDATD